ncbi:putative HTH-type transcriptional regulator [Microtetraspora sp. NBRC 13810]|uniref:LacI family DNA-binding transcriptional regulator n=1 Tax=Microtetraspora sp. NBRC 13810 TaxID=3030990 RepID=UPI0024A1A750|nr:LacI family DNA-binding transcriptional regulator [Microtetraspora sp. NBRC 13810]GLW11543.1 putative HTH-type transcriptional regulator [Microtetraspora sp. NBRC 13810]
MVVTYADIAKRAGTSTAVVSYVLNDGPRNVAPATKERVLTAASELGYRQHRIARALRSGRTGLVGVLTPDATIPYFGELTRAIVRALGDTDRFALVSHAAVAGRSERQAIEALLSAQIDGLLITAFWPDQELSVEIDVPVVYVHHKPEGVEGLLVESDNTHSVQEAVGHLRGHGHGTPAFWGGPDDVGPTGERTREWAALTGGGGSLYRSGYSSEEASAEFRRQHRLGTLARSLVVASDVQALGILSAAYQLGVRIPDDLAVISLDGSAETAFTSPPLTVVRQPVESMAARAVGLLTGHPDDREPLGTLTIRASCGCDYGS